MVTKIHKQIYIDYPEGGTLNTTMCGRVAEKQWDKFDGMNIADSNEEVTCKLCLNQMYHRGLITLPELIKLKNPQKIKEKK